MELDTIGDEKTVLFLIMSDTDTTFNFILAMLQSQLINLLCDRADDVYGGRLPVHVRLILDEFAMTLTMEFSVVVRLVSALKAHR